ncbi:Mu transposase C-terminal domain-containing protein [Bradyrhizobium sp. CB1717]|uniref:Mu transposase C-terminal domain-containing protein n=1 Tax=Bradyrhizobium sp. CB1717 TaxID=3039154 RepID=UPI0024B07A81|nr:Mu transposase C-terminal domain-containing protein [Bradyrhizobium sp. CB1717]WFU24967.1 Mu transposase C-terminal domain-containing protein [Bradyrhizobium sp. CB1717]
MLLREPGPEGALFRIVHVDDDGGGFWLFNVAEMGWPERVQRDLLVDRFVTTPPSFAIEYVGPYQLNLSEEVQDSAAAQTSARYWKIVLQLQGDDRGRGLLFKIQRKARIKKAAEDVGVTRPTVVTAIMRFWQRGMNREAVRSDYDNCGAPGKTRSIESGRKVGRPRTIATGVGISVNDDLRRKMRVGADYYLSLRKPSQKRALNYVVELFFSHRQDEAGRPKIVLDDDRPTLKQFSHYLCTHFPENDRFKARHGQKRYDLETRELLGKADQNTKGPGDEFQVDATVADVYLRSQFDRRRIVGRPVIYFVIDVWSRLIVGVYVGFEGPSWIGAMMALTNMVTPKVEYCRQYGIEIDHEEWPAHHAPRSILADRGELMSEKLGSRIVDTLRIQIGNTTSGRGDLKAIVESRFKIVPMLFKPFMPGYVEPDFGTRGARDYRLESAMDLNDFTAAVIRAVLQHNRSKITGIYTPTEMTTDGMSATPLARWTWGIENRSGALRELSYDEVALAVMPRDSARITGNGIKFRGGFYTCDQAEEGRWFWTARNKGGWSVEVSYDPRSLDKLYLWNPKAPRGYEACRLLPPYQELVGKTLFEYEEKELAEKCLAASQAGKLQAQEIETDVALRAIQEGALAKTRDVQERNTSKRAEVAGIGRNRADEKAFQRPIETIDLAPLAEPRANSPAVAPTIEDPPDAYEDDMLSRLESLEEAGNAGK